MSQRHGRGPDYSGDEVGGSDGRNHMNLENVCVCVCVCVCWGGGFTVKRMLACLSHPDYVFLIEKGVTRRPSRRMLSAWCRHHHDADPEVLLT